jgi:hypothetical protein
LSDVRLAEALDDHASLRGFRASEPTPERDQEKNADSAAGKGPDRRIEAAAGFRPSRMADDGTLVIVQNRQCRA